MIFDLFTSSFLGFVLGSILTLSALILLIALSYLILYFINTKYTTPLLKGVGTIVRKNYEMGNSELWTIIIRIGNKEDEVEVSEADYYRYEIGEEKPVQYVIGKLWKAVFIKKILDY